MTRTPRFLVAATLIAAAACSAPDALQPTQRAPEASREVQAFAAPSSTSAADTSRGYMVVGPQGGNWVFGDHKINFPAGSICDMSQAKYVDWGKPCAPITADVRIDLKWWVDASGHPQVDFSPALRFQPTRRGEVMLYLKDQAAAKATAPVLRYCPLGSFCVDESVLDKALETKRDSRGGFVYRIIRHFSGYNVWA